MDASIKDSNISGTIGYRITLHHLELSLQNLKCKISDQFFIFYRLWQNSPDFK